MEPRAALGDYDDGTDVITLYTTSQNPHLARVVLSAFQGVAPENKLRVIAPDVGGGFGSKIFIYNEETVCAWAAKKIDRPVKWTAERTESFLTDAHGRDHVSHAELALDANGKILGLRVHTIANLGAYPSTFWSIGADVALCDPAVGAVRHSGDLCGSRRRSIRTPCPSTPCAAQAGPRRPSWSSASSKRPLARPGRDPADFRRQNFVTTFPHQTPVILAYDVGDYAKALDKALELADYKGLGARKAASAAKGKLRGVGFSAYIEACGLAPSQAVGSPGRRRRAVGVGRGSGQHGRHGRGPDRVAQPRPGPRDDLRTARLRAARHPDRRTSRSSMATPTRCRWAWAPTARAPARSACRRSSKALDKIEAKAKKVAGHVARSLRGRHRVQGRQVHGEGHGQVDRLHDRRAERLHRAQVQRPGTRARPEGRPRSGTPPTSPSRRASTSASSKIDPQTGVVTIDRWTAVDDFGKLINPMIVEGQVHGGIVHGIGQALDGGGAL